MIHKIVYELEGGTNVNTRAIEIFEKYNLEVLRTTKVRGAILCEAREGIYILKEYQGQLSKCKFQNALLSCVKDNGFENVEEIIPNKEEELLTSDMDGTVYFVKTFFMGKECNVRDQEDCLRTMKTLARLHKAMELSDEQKQHVFLEGEITQKPSSSGLRFEFDKRNKELRRIRKFLREKSQKTYFEIFLMEQYDRFLDQALDITQKYHEEQEGHIRKLAFCHGDYQYHNIIMIDNDSEAVVNFEKCLMDDTMRDLYLFLRKIMEKQDWSVSYGKRLIAEYNKLKCLQPDDLRQLYFRFSYPEKFWKIANFYYNAGKSWIPERNTEKLEKLLQQEESKIQFLKEVLG